jgi:hypothetical protein
MTDSVNSHVTSNMANSTKVNTLRLYLSNDDLKALGELTESLEISQTEVLSRLVASGIRACVEAGNRMPLPLKFKIADDFSRLNEPTKSSYHRK